MNKFLKQLKKSAIVFLGLIWGMINGSVFDEVEDPRVDIISVILFKFIFYIVFIIPIVCILIVASPILLLCHTIRSIRAREDKVWAILKGEVTH
jgi:hypothetical protein